MTKKKPFKKVARGVLIYDLKLKKFWALPGEGYSKDKHDACVYSVNEALEEIELADDKENLVMMPYEKRELSQEFKAGAMEVLEELENAIEEADDVLDLITKLKKVYR